MTRERGAEPGPSPRSPDGAPEADAGSAAAAPGWLGRWGPRLVFGGLLGLALGLVLDPLNTGYFFVFDDFRWIGEATREMWVKPVISPGFMYFRPLVQVLFEIQQTLYGWELPPDYSNTSLLLHVLNALLLLRLLVGLGLPRLAAAAAAGLFVLAPATLEAPAWVSAQTDLLSTFFSLLALRAALLAVDDTTGAVVPRHRRRYALWLAAALLSKEMAVTVPVSAILCLSLRRRLRHGVASPGPVDRVPIRWLVVRSAVVLTAYLALRAVVMWRAGSIDPLVGPQGDFFALLWATNPVANLGSYVVSAFVLPVAQPLGAAEMAVRVGWAAGLGVLVALAVWRARRGAVIAAAAFVVALVPVLWMARPVGSTAFGRFLYSPSIWLAVLLALGLVALGRWQPSRWRRLGAGLAALVAITLAAAGAWSGAYQADLSRRASATARAAIEAVAPYLDTTRPLHVLDLPYRLEEGPYVLKEYAFAEYYGAERVPPLVADRQFLELRDGRLVPTRVVPARAERVAALEGVVEVRLRPRAPRTPGTSEPPGL